MWTCGACVEKHHDFVSLCVSFQQSSKALENKFEFGNIPQCQIGFTCCGFPILNRSGTIAVTTSHSLSFTFCQDATRLPSITNLEPNSQQEASAELREEVRVSVELFLQVQLAHLHPSPCTHDAFTVARCAVVFGFCECVCWVCASRKWSRMS